MRKILKGILSILVALSTFSISTFNNVVLAQTVGQTELACGTKYEVSWVNDQGSFNLDSCHDSFSAALSTMNSKGDDFVIRHSSSKSPAKIIAITNGVAYSYPQRSGKVTLDIRQNTSHDSAKSTYIVKHRELAQPRTTSYNGNGSGNLVINLGGFEGTVDLKDVDLIPMKYIDKGLSILQGGNDITTVNEQPFSVIPKQMHFKVVQNGNYKDLVLYYYSNWGNALPTPNSSSTSIGPAADWMKVGDTYFSYDMQNFYRDRNYRDLAGEYFSYYLFLPWRSKTNVSAATFEKYLNNLDFNAKPASNIIKDLKRNESQLVGEGQTFIDYQNKYGVNALMTFANALLESGNGRSQYAVEKNNLFGWGAVDSSPDNAMYFPSINRGIEEHMALNLRNYLDYTNFVFYGSHVGNKSSGFNVKYASDPYWGAKIAALAYELDKLNNNNNGSLSDYNKYTIGVVDEYKVPVYREANTNNVLHHTDYGPAYQKNYTAILLDNLGTYTKVQSHNLIVNGGIVTSQSLSNGKYPITPYDFNIMVGYINTSKIKVVSGKPLDKPVYNIINTVSDIQLFGSQLQIQGLSYEEGHPLNEVDLVDQRLDFIASDGTVTSFELANLASGKGEYLFGGYIGSGIDISQFTEGTYDIKINTIHAEYNFEATLSKDVNLTYSQKGYDYSIKQIDGVLKLVVSERELDIPRNYNTLLNSATISEDGILSISGMAMIEGLNNSKKNIKHELEVVDLDTGEVIETILLESHIGNYNLSNGYNHILDYSYGWYKGNIDINDLATGQYSFNIKTTVKDTVKTNRIYALSNFVDSKNVKFANEKLYSLEKEYGLSYRLHLYVRPYSLPSIETTLPRKLESYSYLKNVVYDENNKTISIDGSAFIWNVNFGDLQLPTYTLYLANRNTGQLFEYVIDGKDKLSVGHSWDNNVDFPSEFDYKNTWFEFDVDATKLNDGLYDVYLAVASNGYVDIISAVSKANIDIPNYVSSEELSYIKGSLNASNRRQLTLDIKGLFSN